MDADNLVMEGRESEDQLVETWRREQFARLGFGDWQAAYLAQVGADWHLAEQLIARGCDTRFAVVILEPLPA